MTTNWRLAARRANLRERARIIQAIRLFFTDQGYLEAETPHRIPAPAPETHIDAVPSENWFLHPSPELCMKRMVAAGYEKIFQICRCWREGERGSLHLPEFTLLEWYRTGIDYRGLMEECEVLIWSVAGKVGLGQKVIYKRQEIDLAGPWERISVEEAFDRYAPISAKEALQSDLFDETLVSHIEPKLGTKKPSFIYDFPAGRGSLARLKKENPALAERFELYIGGLEIANAFSELTDAEEQRKRFCLEENIRRSLGKTPYPVPERFLDELENMPQAAGIALGVDRLVMVFLNAEKIYEVVAFTPEEL